MKRTNLTLFGFIVTLVVGLTLAFSQKTLLAQQDRAKETTTAKSSSKEPKKSKHKIKKLLKKGNKSAELKESKKTQTKEIPKADKKEVGEKIDAKKDK
ncbi:MAG: hypothetical protein PHG87_07050 [Candidatus Omnitrophica bacterium]|nr:hypothetical protein [Candidatus Omnitrophota bacterium]